MIRTIFLTVLLVFVLGLTACLGGCQTQDQQSPDFDTGSVRVEFHGDISLPELTSLGDADGDAGADNQDPESDADNKADGSVVSSNNQRGLVTVVINRKSETPIEAGDAQGADQGADGRLDVKLPSVP